MSIVFTEKEKTLKFDIVGYQFPDVSLLSNPNDDYDPNWLVVSINYSDVRLNVNEKDPCLLNYELKEITASLDSILQGEETGFIGTFLEPYLSISVTQINEGYAVQIRYVYDNSDWSDIYVCQDMNWNELSEMNNELKRLYNMFPYRKIKEEK